MCEEMPVIPANRGVDKKRKTWRAEEEERHKGSLSPPKPPFHFIHNYILL
jgi:hypothetical protein